MIIRNENYMTGRDEGNYKGFNFRLTGYMGFEIENLKNFHPLAGNKLINYDSKTIRKKLLSMIRYTINNHLRELKGGLKEK